MVVEEQETGVSPPTERPGLGSGYRGWLEDPQGRCHGGGGGGGLRGLPGETETPPGVIRRTCQ